MQTKTEPAVGGGGQRQNDGVDSRASHHLYSTGKSGRQVLRLADGRVVGEVRDGVLVKRVRRSAHMLRKPRAWACDVAVLREAERLGARTVEIHDTETGDVYTAPVARFWARGFPVRRGHGEQVGLALSAWERNGAPGRADAMQLSLFGAGGAL